MEITHQLYHTYASKANSTLAWLATDTKEYFTQRLADEPNNPNLTYYKENPITYKLNNYGFRTNIDFYDGIEGNVFLGCSHTMGIGLHLESTWAYKMNEYVGGNFLNLGVGGSGIGTGFRLLYGFKKILRPKNVFMFYPHIYRYEFFDTNPPIWRPIDVHSKLQGELMPLFVEKNNMEMYYYLHFNAIKTLCVELGASFYVVINGIKPNDYKRTFPNCARDMHFSPSDHINIFEKYKHAYDNKINPPSRPSKFEELTPHPNKHRVYSDI